MGRTVASKQDIPGSSLAARRLFYCMWSLHFLFCSGGALVSQQSESMQDRPSIQGVSLTSAQDTGIDSSIPATLQRMRGLKIDGK